MKRLEDEFAALVGTRHAVAVNNGTTALIAALQVQDLQPGDEVLTTPFTFVATLNAILEQARRRGSPISPSPISTSTRQSLPIESVTARRF